MTPSANTFKAELSYKNGWGKANDLPLPLKLRR